MSLVISGLGSCCWRPNSHENALFSAVTQAPEATDVCSAQDAQITTLQNQLKQLQDQINALTTMTPTTSEPTTMAPTTTLTTMAPSVTPDYRTDGKMKGCANWKDKVTGEMFRGITDYAGCAEKCDNFRGAFSCRGFFLGVSPHSGCAITDGSCTFKESRFNYYEKTGTSAPVAALTTPAPVSTLYSLDQRRVGCFPFKFAHGEYDNSKAYTPHECYLMCKNSAKDCVEFFVGVNGQNGCATSDGYCANFIVQERNFNYYKVNGATTVAPSSDDWNLLAADTGCKGWGDLTWKAWRDVKNDRVMAGSFVKNTLQDCTEMCDEQAQCTVFYYAEVTGKCALTNGQCIDQKSDEYHKYEVAV